MLERILVFEIAKDPSSDSIRLLLNLFCFNVVNEPICVLIKDVNQNVDQIPR